ncbi:hypothetical protein TNCV_1342921 [Trichonephila clavipes]|nr:hypothetical protein TNCV_1342921 [Trichonephila clavipes]
MFEYSFKVVSSDEVKKDVLVSLAALLPQHPAVPNQMDAGSERPNGRIPRPHRNPASFSTRWTPGRIVATHSGADGICRVVTIKTSSGVMTRPVSQVPVLPPHRRLHLHAPRRMLRTVDSFRRPEMAP